jgi:predicted nucleic acid-binding protein
VSFFAGSDSGLLEDALGEGRAYLPPIVAAELLSGDLNKTDRRKLEELLRDLPLCVIDLEHWFRVGQLRERLRRRGLSISTPDAHVAQCALDLDGALLAEDGIFRQVAKHVPLRLAG